MDTYIGRVSTRRGARRHLALHGLAYCGAGTGRIITAELLTPELARTATTAGDTCRRCAAALDDRVRHLVTQAMNRRNNQAAVDAYSDLVDALTTPEQRAANERLIADMRNRIHATRPQRELSPWGALRASWQEAAIRDRVARQTKTVDHAADQPALFAA